jgi:hypothetical protein
VWHILRLTDIRECKRKTSKRKRKKNHTNTKKSQREGGHMRPVLYEASQVVLLLSSRSVAFAVDASVRMLQCMQLLPVLGARGTTWGGGVVPAHDVVVACMRMFVNEVSIKGGRLGTAGIFASLTPSITIILVGVVPSINMSTSALCRCVWGHYNALWAFRALLERGVYLCYWPMS